MGKTPEPTEDAATAEEAPKRHRKTKAALAAGAVASTVVATAAYRRRTARQPDPADQPR